MKKIILLIVLSCFLTSCETSQDSTTVTQLNEELANLKIENEGLKKQLEKRAEPKLEAGQTVHIEDKNVNPEQKEATVKVESISKINKDVSQYLFSNMVIFDFSVVNHSTKVIRGIQGTLIIKDIFGVEFLRVNSDLVGQEILLGETVSFADIGIEINQFIDTHVKLFTTEYKDLIFEYDIKQILYSE